MGAKWSPQLSVRGKHGRMRLCLTHVPVTYLIQADNNVLCGMHSEMKRKAVITVIQRSARLKSCDNWVQTAQEKYPQGTCVAKLDVPGEVTIPPFPRRASLDSYNLI